MRRPAPNPPFRHLPKVQLCHLEKREQVLREPSPRFLKLPVFHTAAAKILLYAFILSAIHAFFLCVIKMLEEKQVVR